MTTAATRSASPAGRTTARACTTTARYYSPVLQRFLSEDPIGFDGGINLRRTVPDARQRWRIEGFQPGGHPRTVRLLTPGELWPRSYSSAEWAARPVEQPRKIAVRSMSGAAEPNQIEGVATETSTAPEHATAQPTLTRHHPQH